MHHKNQEARSRRLEALLRSLEADNQVDAARSAELREALSPLAAAEVPEGVRDDLDARFGPDVISTHATKRPVPTTTAPFIRA